MVYIQNFIEDKVDVWEIKMSLTIGVKMNLFPVFLQSQSQSQSPTFKEQKKKIQHS